MRGCWFIPISCLHPGTERAKQLLLTENQFVHTAGGLVLALTRWCLSVSPMSNVLPVFLPLRLVCPGIVPSDEMTWRAYCHQQQERCLGATAQRLHNQARIDLNCFLIDTDSCMGHPWWCTTFEITSNLPLYSSCGDLSCSKMPLSQEGGGYILNMECMGLKRMVPQKTCIHLEYSGTEGISSIRPCCR